MTEEKQEQPKPELVPVQIIGQKGESALVQHGELLRTYVPKSTVKAGMVEADVIAKGIQYGIDWEAFIDLSELTVQTLARKLRAAGIYTLDDLKQQDRKLIQIGTTMIAQAVQDAAQRSVARKPPRRKQ